VYKLFIADDESIIIQGLKKLLDWSSLDIEIAGEATNGRDAEEAIPRINPDLAILDVRMPIRTGLDILHSIKKQKLKTMVIFLSAHEDFGYAREALELGALNYLTKPADKEKLKKAVKEALLQIDVHAAAKEAMEKMFLIENDRFIAEIEEGRKTMLEFLNHQHNSQIKDIIIYMYKHYSEDITLDKMARMAYMNPYYFSVYFKKISGIHFKDCLTRIRLEQALNILKQEDIKTWDLAERVGFQDSRYFSGLFKKIYGKTPMEYKQYMKTLGEYQKEIN
jgi:two-component system response regulator YesN